MIAKCNVNPLMRTIYIYVVSHAFTKLVTREFKFLAKKFHTCIRGNASNLFTAAYNIVPIQFPGIFYLIYCKKNTCNSKRVNSGAAIPFGVKLTLTFQLSHFDANISPVLSVT